MSKNGPRKLTWLVCIAIALIYFGGMWHRPLFSPDEVCQALTAREMLLSGDFITPTLNGIPCYEKPAPYYWLTAAALKIFGENTFALRLPSALFTLLTAAAIYLFCRFNGEKRKAGAASLLYVCCGTVFAGASNALPDAVPAFFAVVSMLAGYFFFTEENPLKGCLAMAAAAVFAGIGFMSGGFYVPLAAGGVFLIYGLAQKEYIISFSGLAIGLGIFVLTVLPGASYFLKHAHPDFLQAYCQWRNYGLAGSNLLYAAAGILPAVLILPSGIAAAKKAGKDFFVCDKMRLFSLPALLFLTILFVLTGREGIAFALPLFPFFALTGADCLLEAEKQNDIALTEKVLHIFCAVFGGFMVLFTAWHFIPGISGKWKLYTSHSIIPVIMAAGLVLLWYNMAVKEKNIFPERKFLYFCIGCGVLLISLSHIIPFKVLRQYDQTGFIRGAVLPHYSTGARVFADDGMAPAAAWVLRRNVELCFDAVKRNRKALSPDQLKKIIMQAGKKRQQIIIFTRNREFLSEFPSRRTMIRSGRMTAVIYGE